MTETSDGTVRKPSSHSQPSTTLNQIRWLVWGQEGHGPKTVGAGYLTSELGNRTIAWLKGLRADPSQARRPFFVCAPHSFPASILPSCGLGLRAVWRQVLCVTRAARAGDACRLV